MTKNQQQRQERFRQAYYSDDLALPPEADVLCLMRPCFNKYEQKGTYNPGRGYTSYSNRFEPACATCLNHGCPDWRDTPEDEVDLALALAKSYELLTAHKADRTKDGQKRYSFGLKLLDEVRKALQRRTPTND
jgi:hypothetical protein